MLPRVTALVVVVLAMLAPGTASAALHLSQIGSFAKPVYLTAPPGDPHRLFVVEQAGRIVEIRDGQQIATPFLDIAASVKCCGEQGLLSMAFAPDYATSGRFYVYYTAPRAGDSGGSVITVAEFRRSATSPETADPTTRRVVFTVDHPTNSNHNGGQLQFGPDGLLYAATGDGGSGNDPPNNAQNPNVRLGKLLRVDTSSAFPILAPPIYALGLRNPFRFSFDRATGDLTIGDVGQSAREEVDLSPAGTPAGVNYGWRCWEGSIHTPGISPACDPPGAVYPVLEKNHMDPSSGGDGFCAIIGGYVVRDASVPEIAGHYVYGDNCAPGIRSAVLRPGGVTDDTATGLSVNGLTSFGEDSCGHVYATTDTASASDPVYLIDGDAFTPCPEPGPGDGGGGAGGGGGGGNPPPGGDSRAPVVRIGAQHRQRVLRVRGFRLAMSCDEVCAATATGSVRIAGSKRVFVLARAARRLAANARMKVRLRASHRALRAMRVALRRHRRVSATLSVTGRDAAGNAGTAKRRVGARR